MAETSKQLLPEQEIELLDRLKKRFVKHMDRHPDLNWEPIAQKLEANPDKLWSLYEMERTGGEPDVVGYDERGGYLGYRCSPRSFQPLSI